MVVKTITGINPGRFMSRKLWKVSAQAGEFVAKVGEQELLINGFELKHLVWGMNPFLRGNVIEDVLAVDFYKKEEGWYNIGKQLGGRFELVDFQKGNQLICPRRGCLLGRVMK